MDSFKKKFLIIRFSSLGDIILTFPVIKNIKLNNENYEIYYLTKKEYADVIKRNPNVKEVFEFDSFIKTYNRIKKINFDVLIDLHSNFRSFLFSILIKAKTRVRYRKDSIYRRLFVNFKIISPRLEKHVVEKYLKTLKDIGLCIIDKNLDIKEMDFSSKIDVKPGKIIIFQTAFLGDLILTLPVIKKLKASFRELYLCVVARKDLSNALLSVGEIDEVIADDKKNSSIKEFFRVINIIKSKKFDVAIIPHRSIRTALMAYFSKIKFRIGFDIKPSSFFYTHKIPFKWLIHDVERNLMLLNPLMENINGVFPEIKFENNEKFDYIFNIKPLIIINPSSSWETKKWPAYKFVKLINLIYEKYHIPVILIGTKKEKEYITLNIESKLNQLAVINLAGKTTLEELMNLIKNSDLLITNDSGPMHIAAAFDINIISFFGPTTKELGFFPYSKKALVLEKNLPCRPCSLHGSERCPRNHFLCMKLIKVDEVLKTVEKILKYKYE